MKICVIENNDLLRDALALCLSELGHDVIVSRDGRTGAEMALANQADLVLTDMRLPHLSGKEVIATLRKHLPEAIIVAMSATDLNSTTERLEVERLGADMSLTKPFSITNMLAGLERRRLIRQA